MATFYGVQFDSYLRGGPPFVGDTCYNCFEALADAQKGIDALLWVFTDTGGFCEGASLEFVFDIYKDAQHTTTVELTPYIVLSGPRGDRYPLNKEGVLAGAEFLNEGVNIAGQRLSDTEFPSFARPWVDWSRVPFDPTPDTVLRGIDEAETISALPFGLQELLICDDDDVQQVLRCDPAWLVANDRRVTRIAEHVRETGDLSGLGVLADALDEAGCDNPWFLWHLRLPAEAHARGSWVVGYLIEQATKED